MSIVSKWTKVMLIFMSITIKQIQFDENGGPYILFRTDIYLFIYFLYLLAVEIDEKNMLKEI